MISERNQDEEDSINGHFEWKSKQNHPISKNQNKVTRPRTSTDYCLLQNTFLEDHKLLWEGIHLFCKELYKNYYDYNSHRANLCMPITKSIWIASRESESCLCSIEMDGSYGHHDKLSPCISVMHRTTFASNRTLKYNILGSNVAQFIHQMNRRQCLPSSCFLFLVWQIVLLFVLILLGNPDLGERWAINILNTNMTFLSPTSDRNPVLQAQGENGRPCQWLSNNKFSLQLPRTFQIKSCNAKEETLSTYSTKQNFAVFFLCINVARSGNQSSGKEFHRLMAC